MMIADEQQKAKQPDRAILMGEVIQPTPFLNVDLIEELLATHITR